MIFYFVSMTAIDNKMLVRKSLFVFQDFDDFEAAVEEERLNEFLKI